MHRPQHAAAKERVAQVNSLSMANKHQPVYSRLGTYSTGASQLISLSFWLRVHSCVSLQINTLFITLLYTKNTNEFF